MELLIPLVKHVGSPSLPTSVNATILAIIYNKIVALTSYEIQVEILNGRNRSPVDTQIPSCQDISHVIKLMMWLICMHSPESAAVEHI